MHAAAELVASAVREVGVMLSNQIAMLEAQVVVTPEAADEN